MFESNEDKRIMASMKYLFRQAMVCKALRAAPNRRHRGIILEHTTLPCDRCQQTPNSPQTRGKYIGRWGETQSRGYKEHYDYGT